ncbi:hypothetical protein DAI22_03g360932 [Oryza sativa Japonica Group]|nr:hypothetical protein DAI22_03g360932 [Oryza sativa Japonica Group]
MEARGGRTSGRKNGARSPAATGRPQIQKYPGTGSWRRRSGVGAGGGRDEVSTSVHRGNREALPSASLLGGGGCGWKKFVVAGGGGGERRGAQVGEAFNLANPTPLVFFPAQGESTPRSPPSPARKKGGGILLHPHAANRSGDIEGATASGGGHGGDRP